MQKKNKKLCAFRAHSALTPILQLHCSSPTLLIVSFHACHTLLLLLFLFASLSVKALVSLLLSDDECWSSGEEEGEEEEDVSQGAFWCSAFCGPACAQTGWQAGSTSVQLEALNRRRRDLRFYFKHKLSHPEQHLSGRPVQNDAPKERQCKHGVLV